MLSNRTKDSLRAAVLSARAALPEQAWRAEDAARTAHALATIGRRNATVALYAARGGEPGTRELIDGLVGLGWRVLLPVLRRNVDWATFTGWGETRPGWADIPEPTGHRLGAGALAEADLILVSSLLIGRDGSRLGTGGGWYDRALPHRNSAASLIAIGRDAELVATLPQEPHDVPVEGVVTETGWVNFAS